MKKLLGVDVYEDSKLGKIYIWYYSYEGEL